MNGLDTSAFKTARAFRSEDSRYERPLGGSTRCDLVLSPGTEIDASPTVELNRAVAASFCVGPTAALPIVGAMRQAGRLPHRHAVAAVLANPYAQAGSDEPARRFLDEALTRARSPHERELIALQIGRLRANPSAEWDARAPSRELLRRNGQSFASSAACSIESAARIE
jgi:hypothetical protein